MQSITGQKKEIRARCRAIRREMSTAQKSFADTAIAEKVLQLIEEKRPGRLLCYVSAYPTEVSTTAIIKRALEMQLAVAVPRCIPECSGMDFYLENFTDFGSRQRELQDTFDGFRRMFE